MFIFIPEDSGDDIDVTASSSTKGIFSLLNPGVDVNTGSMTGISSIICPGVDAKLIIDGELNIFGGESNVFVVSDDFNIWPFVFIGSGKDRSYEFGCCVNELRLKLLAELLFDNDLIR